MRKAGRARFLPVTHKLLGRTIIQCAVRSHLVVVAPPALELVLDVAQIEKSFDVETLIAKSPVEGFDVAIVDRLSVDG